MYFKVFSHISMSLGVSEMSILSEDCWVGCQVAGAAALLFSWLRSATNTVKSVEDWG